MSDKERLKDILMGVNAYMLENIEEKYDIIISNPPYIAYNEEVDEIVKNNEPLIALYANNNGLENYEKILKKAKDNLNNPGIVAFEIGMNQGEKIKQIASGYFNINDIKIEKDLTGKDRYIFIFNK